MKNNKYKISINIKKNINMDMKLKLFKLKNNLLKFINKLLKNFNYKIEEIRVIDDVEISTVLIGKNDNKMYPVSLIKKAHWEFKLKKLDAYKEFNFK
jgi:hypothetical protein